MKTILASDIGSRNNGIGIIRYLPEEKQIKYVTAYNHNLAPLLMSERLLDLENVLLSLIDNYEVTDLAYENPVVRGPNGIDLQHICAIHKLVVAKRKLGFKDFTATKVKKTITGVGSADKYFVANKVSEFLNIPKDKKFDLGNHDSDALAVAITYAIEVYKYGR